MSAASRKARREPRPARIGSPWADRGGQRLPGHPGAHLGGWLDASSRCSRCLLAAGCALIVALGSFHPAGVMAGVGTPAGSFSLKFTALIGPPGTHAGPALCLSVHVLLPASWPADAEPWRRGHLVQRGFAWAQRITAQAGDRDGPGAGHGRSLVPDGPGALRAHGVACGPVPSPRGFPKMPGPQVPAWRSPRAVRTLACMEWLPARPARPPRGGCMGGTGTSRQPQHARPTLAGPLAVWPASRPGLLFRDLPGLAGEMPGAGRHAAAAGVPARPCAAGSGNTGQLSSGDRASLPGRPTRYKVIWLVCAHCGATRACLSYDEHDIPVCVNAHHGPMEFRGEA